VKVLLSWIREFVDVPGSAEEIGARMSLRGLALEGIETHGGDAVLDFDVTANRPDCLSIRGIAREIATAYRLPLTEGGAEAPSVGKGRFSRATPDDGSGQKSVAVPVTIDDPDLCARYVAAVADVAIGPSPDWMQARLAACGVRAINNIVDVTNYVLLELGHPMHAFDRARLRGPAIVVRRARPGEGLITLDGKQRTLDPDMLVIADAERASAIGGVMGGADSEVSDGTQQIVLESAWFKPQSVRATSKRLAMRTEASYRFERGADLTAPVEAMERALDLLESIGAGRREGPIVDVYPVPHQPRELVVELHAAAQLLGMDVPAAEAEQILTSLGFAVRPLGGWHAAAPDAAVAMGRPAEIWSLTVPPWRVDVQRPVDVIEEIGRHHGFEHLPVTFPAVEQAPSPSDPRIARDARVRQLLLAAGFSEAISFAFTEAGAAAPYLGDHEAVVLTNPLSEKFTTLRPSLIPGLVDAVSHNRRHGRRDVRLFEIGTRFSPTGERRAAAAIWTGLATTDHWSGGGREVDFFDVKGVAEQLCALMNVVPEFTAAGPSFLVDGRKAEVHVNGHVVGVVGQIAPPLTEQRDVPAGEVSYVLEFDLDSLSAGIPAEPRFAKALPRHPSVIRDLSVVVDEILSAATVRDTIRAASPPTLVDVHEFDRYQGKGIPEGKVSLSLRLTFQAADRTLTDTEVHGAMDGIVAALKAKLGAIQR
jgi:phenylalanyl-tRNA synthetase beta chain